MESEALSHPLDDAGFDAARPDEAAGARTVSPCGAAIVIALASFARPHAGQNRAPSVRVSPQPEQTTAGFYPRLWVRAGDEPQATENHVAQTSSS